MKIPEQWLMRAYGAALELYPAAFRAKYGVQMMDAVRLGHRASTNEFQFLANLAWDTVWACLREHWREASPARPGYAMAFAAFFTGMLLTVAVSYQQVLRVGADRQPRRLVEAIRSAQGQVEVEGPRMEIASAEWLEAGRAFAVIYDGSGRAVAGDATLHGALPQPPRGIFGVLRERGWDHVTWQPEPSIRVALVGARLADGGYVLAGQSLTRSERQDARFHDLLLWIWLGMVVTAVGIVLLGRLPVPNG